MSTDLHPDEPVVAYRSSMTPSRRMRGAALAFAAIAAISLSACGDDGGSSDDAASTTAAPTETTAAPTATTMADGGAATGDVTIIIKNVAFTTPDVTVTAGGSVTFDNQDNQAHTATGQGSGAFATDTIGVGEKKTVTFDEPGTYPFICSFHPFMKGTVTVE